MQSYFALFLSQHLLVHFLITSADADAAAAAATVSLLSSSPAAAASQSIRMTHHTAASAAASEDGRGNSARSTHFLKHLIVDVYHLNHFRLSIARNATDCQSLWQ